MKSRFDPESFLNVFQHDSDLERTVDFVKSCRPSRVLAGFESGVELADQLAQRLCLPGNGGQLSEARRDKFLMNEVVREHGLRTAVQFRSSRIEEILDWIDKTLDWPVILKPPKSVASDHVFCCHSADEVRQSAQAILSNANVLGGSNPTVLVQEHLAGIEYAVDVVSCQGQKKTTAIWQYSRPGNSSSYTGYNAMTLLPYVGERQAALQSYAFKVLDALAIQFGPAHCELMWADGEPVLVEVGARLSAGINAILSRICGGICQLDETVDAILAPQQFLSTLKDQPSLQSRAVNVFLAPKCQGRLARLCGVEEIRRLPTLHAMSVRVKPGDPLGRVAGLVTLVDKDLQAIQHDIDVIRGLEQKGIFELEQ